jgi:putative peptidoglycan lipid II flippase
MFLSLPASAALFIGSEEIISALFGYGSFSKEAVLNSSEALYYFGLGLPAFVLIKIFSTFFFANNDTKTPFYISLISVMLNICISVYYFKSIGFIIIPIATTISSWFNSFILFIYLRKRDLFRFNKTFLSKLIKILFASILMSLFFEYLILFFEKQLTYEYYFKSFYLILSVFLAFSFYLILSLFIKAFKYGDIRLKY